MCALFIKMSHGQSVSCFPLHKNNGHCAPGTEYYWLECIGCGYNDGCRAFWIQQACNAGAYSCDPCPSYEEDGVVADPDTDAEERLAYIQKEEKLVDMS